MVPIGQLNENDFIFLGATGPEMVRAPTRELPLLSPASGQGCVRKLGTQETGDTYDFPLAMLTGNIQISATTVPDQVYWIGWRRAPT
jgi:hypothetical protein